MKWIKHDTDANQDARLQHVMLDYGLESGLFESSDGVISCLKLAKRLDKSMTSNPEMRGIIENLRSHDPIMTESEIVMQEETRIDKNKHTVLPSAITPDLLAKISEYWNTTMTTQPKINLTAQSQINKKRIKALAKIIKDHSDYADHEYWAGHIGQLATMPARKWQRDNTQLQFDQAIQLDKFEANLGLMRMGS